MTMCHVTPVPGEIVGKRKGQHGRDREAQEGDQEECLVPRLLGDGHVDRGGARVNVRHAEAARLGHVTRDGRGDGGGTRESPE